MKRKRCPACKIKRLALDAPKRAVCGVCVRLGVLPRVPGSNVDQWKRNTARRLICAKFVGSTESRFTFPELAHTARCYD